MINLPKQLVEAFLEWFENDPYSRTEDVYKKTINEKWLRSLGKKEFIEFFYQFIADGGGVQSGGHRSKNKFRDEISSNYKKFHDLVLQPFAEDFDVSVWLPQSEKVKFFGKGISTIYLNRVDKYRFPIVNNKTKDALSLLGVDVPSNLVKAYKVIGEAQRELIRLYPEFDNFFRADKFNHFLIGTDEGKNLAKQMLKARSASDGELRKLISDLRSIHCFKERLDYRKAREKEARGILEKQPISQMTEGDWLRFLNVANNDLWDGRELNTRFGVALRGNNRVTMMSNISRLNSCTEEIWNCTEGNIEEVLNKWWNNPITGIGTSFPTLLLYLKNPGKHNLWIPTMNLGLEIITGKKLSLRRTYGNYLKYNNEVSDFLKKFGMAPQEADIILSLRDDLRLVRPTEDDSVGLPLNLILYGPPGTGKTYTLRSEYFEKFTSKKQIKTKGKYAEEIAEQTAWWEIVAMAMMDAGAAKVPEIMKHPLVEAKAKLSVSKHPRSSVWAMLQTHTKNDCQNVQYSRRVEPLVFSKDEGSLWSIDMDLVETELGELKEQLEKFNNFSEEEMDEDRYIFTTFHQSYSYEDFVEGIKPVVAEEGAESLTGEISYAVKPGVFRVIADRALNDPGRPYAIFIDEISRGNVASIFGELIALIEDDKRKDADNELKAQLPYSREDFVVPGNLHIIGTMNTADRSVVALDTALRRRFSFQEVKPDPELIKQPDGLDVDLKSMLKVINDRILRLIDSDHLIGHSYFMGLEQSPTPLQDLQIIFANKVLPLLQEYFYGDPGKIGMVLGGAFAQTVGNGADFASGSWAEDAYEEKPVFQLVDPLEIDEEGFRSIYG